MNIMTLMSLIPIELKNKIMSYLPILDNNKKILNSIIKNYKHYFIKALLYEYSKYFDDTYYISKYILEWPHINEILKRVDNSKDLLI